MRALRHELIPPPCGRAIACGGSVSSPPPERGRACPRLDRGSASAASREGVSLLQLLRLTALHIIEMTPPPTLPLLGGGGHASQMCKRPPPLGEGRRAGASRGGGFQRRHHRSWIFPVALTPPPDRRFAHSRCKASAFLFLRTATKGRLCTLPTLSRGRDKGPHARLPLQVSA